jgi:hypothetical protein
MKDGWMLRSARIALLATLAAPFACAQFTPAESAFSIPQAQLIQPEALNHMLQSARPEKPLVLQVGSHVLFAEAHIPGSEYVGPGSQPAGLQALQSRVDSLPRARLIVLYLADNFGADWAAKGYPVEQSR